MEMNTELVQPKKTAKSKKKSTVKKSAQRRQKKASPKSALSKASVRADAGGLFHEAKSFVASRTRGQKAAIAAGAIGFLTLLSNRKGRGLLKTLGGLALPIVAGYAQDKVVERATRSI